MTQERKNGEQGEKAQHRPEGLEERKKLADG